jgi:signal transduction histidine kinase
MPGFEENLQNLIAWARDGVTHDPNRLFRAIVMQFLSSDHPPDAEDRPSLLKILRDIQSKVDLPLRQELARSFTKYAKPPQEIVRIFADDDLAVARIVLENSGGLSDEDLIDIAQKGTAAHRQAIVMRRGLSPSVRMAVFKAGIEKDTAQAAAEPLEPLISGEPAAAPEPPAPPQQAIVSAPPLEPMSAKRVSAAAKPEEPQPRAPETLSRLEMALERHGQRPIRRDIDRAREFLDKIQTIRAPVPKQSLVERLAGHDKFADVRTMGDEPKHEDVERAEAFLATIQRDSVQAAPVEPPAAELPLPEAPAPVEATSVPPAAPLQPDSEPVAAAAEELPILDLVDEVNEEPEPTAATAEAPEPVEAPIEDEPETAPPEPAAPPAQEPVPEGELVIAGDLFQKSRASQTPASRIAARTSQERDYARAAVDWAWETDPDGVVTFLSEGAGQALGIAESRVLGKPLAELGHFTGEGFDPRKAADATARRVPYRDQVFETATDSGPALKWLVAAVPLFDLRSGRFRGYRGTASGYGTGSDDASVPAQDTANLEETVEAAAAENRELMTEVSAARAGVSARTDRMASVSHELRTPLNAIMGFSDAMASEAFGPLDAKYKEYARDILTSASEVNEIINDVLDKAKLDAGAMPSIPGPVPLMMLLEQGRKDIAAEAENRQMDLSYAAPKTELVVHVDIDHAQRVVATLLRSAVRFGKRGGRIGVEALLDRPGVAQINIWNDGPAISSETIAAMLPASKRSQADEEPQVGLGLTLSVARGFARLMGGDVGLQSKAGVGNRFIIEFPVES